MKIILTGPSAEKPFTYTTDSYKIEDDFIIFTDNRGVKRTIPISRLIEVQEEAK